MRPSHAGQVGLALRTDARAAGLADLTAYEKMVGEYQVMGICLRGHLMEFIRPRLSGKVLPTLAIEACREGEQVQVAGWPIARQHPKGGSGVAERFRHPLRGRVVLVEGKVSRYGGTTSVIVSDLQAIDAGVRMPEAHDWH